MFTKQFIEFVEKYLGKTSHTKTLINNAIKNALNNKDFYSNVGFDHIDDYKLVFTTIWKILDEFFSDYNISKEKNSNLSTKVINNELFSFIINSKKENSDKTTIIEKYSLIFDLNGNIHNNLFSDFIHANILLNKEILKREFKLESNQKLTPNALALLVSAPKVSEKDLINLSGDLIKLRSYKKRYSSYVYLLSNPLIQENEDILSLISKDKDYRVRTLVIEAFKKFKNDILSNLVVILSKTDNSNIIRMKSIQELIFQITDEEVLKSILLDGLKDDDYEIREYATKIINEFELDAEIEQPTIELDLEKEVNLLIEKARNKNSSVREKALTKFKDHRHPKLKNFLMKSLKKKSIVKRTEQLLWLALDEYLDEEDVVEFYIEKLITTRKNNYALDVLKKTSINQIPKIFEFIHELFERFPKKPFNERSLKEIEANPFESEDYYLSLINDYRYRHHSYDTLNVLTYYFFTRNERENTKENEKKDQIKDLVLEQIAKETNPKLKKLYEEFKIPFNVIDDTVYDNYLKRLSFIGKDIYDDPEIINFNTIKIVTESKSNVSSDFFIKTSFSFIELFLAKISEIFNSTELDSLKRRYSDNVKNDSYFIARFLSLREDSEKIVKLLEQHIDNASKQQMYSLMWSYKPIHEKLKNYIKIKETKSEKIVKKTSEKDLLYNNFLTRSDREELSEILLYISPLMFEKNDDKPLDLLIDLIDYCLVDHLIEIGKLIMHFQPENKLLLRDILLKRIPETLTTFYHFKNGKDFYESAVERNLISKDEYYDVILSFYFRFCMKIEDYISLTEFIKKEFNNEKLDYRIIITKFVAELYSMQYLPSDATFYVHELDNGLFEMKINKYIWSNTVSCSYKFDFYKDITIPFLIEQSEEIYELLIYYSIYSKSRWELYTDKSIDFLNINISNDEIIKLPSLANAFFVKSLHLMCQNPSIKNKLKKDYLELFVSLFEENLEIIEEYGKNLKNSLQFYITNPVLEKTISNEPSPVSSIAKKYLLELIFELNPDYIKKNLNFLMSENNRIIRNYVSELVAENDLLSVDVNEQIRFYLDEINRKIEEKSETLKLNNHFVRDFYNDFDIIIDKVNSLNTVTSITNLFSNLSTDQKLLFLNIIGYKTGNFDKSIKEIILMSLKIKDNMVIAKSFYLASIYNDKGIIKEDTIEKAKELFLKSNLEIDDQVKVLEIINEERLTRKIFAYSLIKEVYNRNKNSSNDKFNQALFDLYLKVAKNEESKIKIDFDDLVIISKNLEKISTKDSQELKQEESELLKRKIDLLIKQIEKSTAKDLKNSDYEMWVAETLGRIALTQVSNWRLFNDMSKAIKKIYSWKAFEHLLNIVEPYKIEFEEILEKNINYSYTTNQKYSKSEEKLTKENTLTMLYAHASKGKSFFDRLNSTLNRKKAAPILRYYIPRMFRYPFYFVEALEWKKLLRNLPPSKETDEVINHFTRYIIDTYPKVKNWTTNSSKSSFKYLLSLANSFPYHTKEYIDFIGKLVRNNEVDLIISSLSDWNLLLEFGYAKQLYPLIKKFILSFSEHYVSETGRVSKTKPSIDRLKRLEWIDVYLEYIPEKKEEITNILVSTLDNCHDKAKGVINASLNKMGYYSDS